MPNDRNGDFMSKNKNLLTYIGITAAACLMYAVSAGLRSVYRIMLNTIVADTGIAYASVSFVIAVGQLVFGVAEKNRTPFGL